MDDSPEKRFPNPRGEWQPDPKTSPDAELVGMLGASIAFSLRGLTPLRQVYAVESTWRHVLEEHEGQHDYTIARSSLPSILRKPQIVYAGRKANTVVFARLYDATHFLVVPLKIIHLPQEELWLQSMYIRNDTMVWADLRKTEVYFAEE